MFVISLFRHEVNIKTLNIYVCGDAYQGSLMSACAVCSI